MNPPESKRRKPRPAPADAPAAAGDGDQAEARRRRVAELAYAKAERRGFHGDHHLQDWLEAEQEIEAAEAAATPTELVASPATPAEPVAAASAAPPRKARIRRKPTAS